MSTKTSDLPPDFPGFPDIAALKTAHARLVQRPQGEAATEDFLKDVEGFVIRAQATGRILSDEDDRTAAQNIIDYWVTVLLRGRRTPPETGLAEFGFHAPGGSLRDQPVQEYLAEQRMAIRRRLGLSAAAAQWQDGGRNRALLWGGRELWNAAEYEDLSQLEREFIAASQALERRATLIRRLVIVAALFAVVTILTLIIAGLVVQKREAEANSRLMQHQVAKTLVERAAVLMRDGDVSGSLLWLAQALLEDREAHQDERIHRIRLGAATAQLPKLRHVLLEENSSYLCNSAKFNADGSLVLTVSNPKKAGEGVARLWDAATGKKLADFPDTEAKVNDAGFCADGRIITASGDPGRGPGRVRIWQQDGRASTEFVVSERAVLSATMSPERDRVALLYDGPGDQPAVLEVRRISDGISCTGPLEWPGEIRDVKFSPDGFYVAAGGAIDESQPGRPAGQVKVWRAWDGRPCSWGDMRHDLPVNCLAFAPDNRLAAGSGELDGGRGTVEVWSIFTGQEFYTTDRPKAADRVFAQEHHGLVMSVCFSPDGRRMLSASHDETARVWDARTGAALLEFKHESSVYQAAYSPDGRTIVSGGRDHAARVWKVATGKAAVPPLSHGLTVTQTVFSPDGERVLTTTDDGARIWELRTGEPLAPILKLSDPIWKMAISADGRVAVAVSRSGAIRTWDTQRSTEGRPFAVPEERLPALSGADGVFFSADASLALIARGARAQIWNTRGGAAASPIMDNGAPISFVVFSPDRTRVLLASGTRGATKGVTRLWDVTSGNPIGQPLEAAGVVTFATFSADGRYLLTASGTRSPASGEARVWDVESGRPVTSPLLHNEEVTHASFSLDLRHAVTASVDNTAKIWSLDLSARTPAEAATESRPLAEHSADLIHASFSPDGRTVVTASYDRTAVLWDATTGDRISVLQHPGWINDVSFSRDGRFLVTACADQTVRVWEAATGEWISLFHHNGEVTRAFFAGDEDLQVTTLSAYEPAQTLPDAQRSVPPPGGGSSEPDRDQTIPRTMLKVQSWRLPQAPQPAPELYDFAQLMRSRQIAEKRDFTRLPRHEFARRWKERAGVVAQFNADVTAVPPRYAAQESEATGEWFAFKWHLNRLIAAEPADIGLRVRRGFASANLLQWPEAVEDYLEAAKQEPSRPILLRLARAEIEIGKFDQAIAHATQGIDALAPAAPTPADKTDERNLRMLRAEAYSATQRWDEAAADLLKSIELKPRLPSSYQRLAIVRLKQGQDAEYRKLCAQMLDLFGDDDGLASTAAWACVLRERAVADYAIVVNLAGRTLADQPGSYYNLNTLGAALYRAGRYREAIEKLTESRAAYVKAASQAQTRSEADALLMPLQDGRPADWLFLAMAVIAESKSGRSAEAEDWLKRAEDSMTSRSITDPRRTWHRLELELLLEEATTKIRPTP